MAVVAERSTSNFGATIARAVLACVAVMAAGCGIGGPAEFVLNTEGRDAESITPVQQDEIRTTLTRLFGTPDEVKAPPEAELDSALLERAAGLVRSDDENRQFGVYRQHCVTCHGISGDGVGPTASMQDPYPRDLRSGVYKYTSTARGAKPTREDLDRLIRRGIPGTAMPSFDRLPDEEIEALIEYVRYLSIRGETELYLMQLVVDEDDYPVNIGDIVYDAVEPAAMFWAEAAELHVDREEAETRMPDVSSDELWRESVRRGYELYSSKAAQCAECHGPEGRGDGPQSELYDDWNKPKKGATDEETRKLAELFRLPIQRLRPRNFTEGVFRGGDRPIDLYWRVHCGIKGTPMPSGGPAPGSQGVLTPEQIWDVVNYIRSRAKAGASSP